ncbi:tail fiber domain-containing protein [Dyadobacter sp. CY356]|uniref:tail fiber domain-containing protein n=1 Tax=Dyadobacter sp. CY356 TaxID=2906442 RepID=UPI001F47EF67|nr:tail fiber domain-containing protein [Dyadobacter sp. CY356]MCF0054718.1 tail fiber domain-containing protein [Dyadobacter sp. CY356]
MKAKQLLSKTLCSTAFAGLLFASSTVLAQVKIGSSPTVIANNANLNVQSTNGNRTVVLKDNGFFGIGTVTPTNLLTLGPGVGANATAVAGKKLAVFQTPAGDDFYGLGINPGVLQFHAASLADEAPAMVLTGAGKLGVGTTAPISRFHVNETNDPVFGSTIAAFGRPDNKLFFLEISATLGAYNGLVKQGDAHLIFSPDGDPYTNMADAGLVIAPWAAGGTSGLKIMESGFVGVMTSSPTAALSVNGDANKPGGGSWSVFSDIRSKENVHNYNKGLNELMKIRPVTFNYKKEMNWGTKDYVGIIAQEVQAVLPGMVKEIKVGEIKDFKEVDPNEFTYLLINSVKELKAQVDALKSENIALKAQTAKLDVLESKLAVIEAKLGAADLKTPALLGK